jgi:site-specific recombinase XerD
MKVIYLFYEPNSVRVPFFWFDHCLFSRLIAQGGVWEKNQRQFVFKHDISPEWFCRLFLGIPCVWVEDNASNPMRIFGLKDYPWEDSLKEEHNPSNARFTLLDSPPLPDNFPEYWRIKLEDELRSRKYSPRTRNIYIYFNRLLCRTLQKTPEEIHPEDITRFLATIEKNKEYSASSMNLAISSIKFFYHDVMKKKIIDEQHRPYHDGDIPQVLSKEEIKKLLTLENNPKHRLLLMLAYSSGLRVSELVALKKEHIDSDRKVVYIRFGKGRKDRYTLLSEKVAEFISEYCTLYGIKTWLFPGQPPIRHLSTRSAQYIFEKAARRAEIHKKTSIHGLRHTFATHLLENGTDIRYIQSLLGHANIRTTERYTRVARRNALNIQSPLDSIL